MTTTHSTAAFSEDYYRPRSGDVIQFPGGRGREPVVSITIGWTEAVQDRLQQLIRLPIGWDGYRGQPVAFANAYFAMDVLNVVCGPDTDAPQIVPGPEGDLQIEWHTSLGDLELHVKGPNDVRAWYARSDDDSEGQEADLDVDYRLVARWLREIQKPLSSGVIAA